jgi:hypothetical protein
VEGEAVVDLLFVLLNHHQPKGTQNVDEENCKGVQDGKRCGHWQQ